MHHTPNAVGLAETRTRPIDLLVVEDNPGDVGLIQDALRHFPIPPNVHVAPDGEAALAFLRRVGPHTAAPRPDLILLDLSLPRQNGYAVLAEVKADPSLLLIPVIVLTGSSAEADVLRAYGLHANCCITKPLDQAQLQFIMTTLHDFWFTIVVLPRKVQ